MKTPSPLAACCFVLCSTLLTRASPVKVAPASFGPHAAKASTSPAFECGGEPCDAVLRGLRAFLDRSRTAWTVTVARAPTAICRRIAFSSRPPASRHGSSSCNGGAAGIPDADDPLFRPIDADDFRTNGDDANDFGNLRQNGLVRITLPLPPNIRLIDPATNAVSNETTVDVWRMVPTVNDVALTGSDTSIPVWPRDPNPTGGYQLDARLTTLQEQALGALVNHAQIPDAPAQQLLDDLSSFQRVLFTNHRVRALSDAVREGATAPAGSGSATQRARTAGQGGVRARVQSLPRRSRTVDPGVPGESIQQHLEPVSASSGHGDARSLRVRRVSAATGPQRTNLRDRAFTADAGPGGHHSCRDQGASHELRSRACAADRLRWRPWP